MALVMAVLVDSVKSWAIFSRSTRCGFEFGPFVFYVHLREVNLELHFVAGAAHRVETLLNVFLKFLSVHARELSNLRAAYFCAHFTQRVR